MEDHIAAHEKLKHLREIIKELQKTVIAFSGGVDSAFLLKVAVDVLGSSVVAVTADSAIHPQRELDHALDFARKMGTRHVLVKTDELSDSSFTRNPKNRCYICKRALFWKMKEIAESMGIQTILEGSNTDDLTDYRPGMRALHELGIRSPLLESGLTKSEIRELSREMGLDTWERQSFSCLATRFPYGETITYEKLMRVDECESYILSLGFKRVRVRHHGDLARIEVGEEEIQSIFKEGIADLIDAQCRKSGFTYSTIDLRGYRTGSMNERVKNEQG